MVMAVLLFAFFAEVVGWAYNTLVSGSAYGEDVAYIAFGVMWEEIIFDELIDDVLFELLGKWWFLLDKFFLLRWVLLMAVRWIFLRFLNEILFELIGCGVSKLFWIWGLSIIDNKLALTELFS
jgi:hypothetical protein